MTSPARPQALRALKASDRVWRVESQSEGNVVAESTRRNRRPSAKLLLSESARGHDYDSEEHDDDDDSRIVAVEAAVEPALSSTDFSSDDMQLAMQPSTPGSSLGQQILLTIQLLQSRMANLERLLLPTVPTNTSQSSILSYPSTRSVGDAVDEIF